MKKLINFTLIGLLLILVLPDLSHAGNALRFNLNNSERVRIPDSESLDINGQGLTMEAWIYVPEEDTALAMTIWNKEDSYEAQVRAGLFQVAIRTQGGWVWLGDNARLRSDEWMHVAGTYDGRFVRLYVNGELMSSHAKQGNIETSDDPFYLGTRPLNNFTISYTGDLDEMRLWNVAHTEEEIQETMNIMLAGDEEGLVGYWRLDEGEGQAVNDLTANENHGFLGSEEDEDRNDPEWIVSEAPVYGGEIVLSRDAVHFIPIGIGGEIESRDEILVISNISEDDDEHMTVDFSIEYDGDRPEWLSIDPMEGEIDAGEEVEITFTASSEDMDTGEYDAVVFLHSNSANLRMTEIPVSIIFVDGVGSLRGRVTDAANDEQIEGALVETVADFNMRRVTDEDGNYDFGAFTPAHTYRLSVSADDFLTYESEEIAVHQREAVTQNFELLHSEFAPRPERIEVSLAPDESIEIPLRLSNPGNGPLTWSVDRIFPEGADADPWDIRDEINVEEITEDNQINGVAFADGHFFISGGNRREDVNKIYVFNTDGDLIRQLDQFHESDYGMRDLTWDGELIWGSDENVIYGFDYDGELISTIEGQADSYRSLTWDPDNNVFWSANVTSDIFATNMDGEVVREIRRPGDLRTYGMSYWSDDPDGYNLYVFARGTETDIQVSKVSLDNGDAVVVAEIEFDGEPRPGGIFITNRYDAYSWIFAGIVQSPDRLVLWHLDSRTDWLTIEPEQDVIDAGDNTDLNVVLSSVGMPEETELNATLSFTHDGIGGQNEIPVLLSVTGEGGLAHRTLNMNIGWNLVSVSVEPEIDDIPELFAPLVDEGSLLLIKDGSGHFYYPAHNFNNIERWVGVEGYQIKMARNADFRIGGEAIPWDTEIDLEDGWNMVAYLLSMRGSSAPIALSNIEESLVIAKDGAGRFYIPAWDYSDLYMYAGSGYQINVDGNQVFVWSSEFNNDRVAGSRYSADELSWLSDVSVTGSSYSLLVLAEGLPAGSRLCAYTPSGIQAGRGVVGNDGKCGLTLWGASTGESKHPYPPPYPNGFCEGESILIKASTSKLRQVLTPDATLNLEWLVSSDTQGDWKADGWGVARVTNSAIPIEFGIHKTYPNPFNGQLRIEFAIETQGSTTLKAYDLSGREITNITSGVFKAGIHSTIWNAEKLPSGMYIIKLSSSMQTQAMKIVLVR
ncbi:MAG: LamG-like jellyroll fold domain-containing protein [Candidatus Hatepunaea meridiana]|nr:LamG-like jellyroll fold domain-containing protein [Candidatus Hatepunaea meridiana]